MAEFEWNKVLWLNQILVGGKLRAELQREGMDFAVQAADATPVDTGLMRASWRTDVAVEGDRLKATVSNTASKPGVKGELPYPLFVEYGRGSNQGFYRRLISRQGI